VFDPMANCKPIINNEESNDDKLLEEFKASQKKYYEYNKFCMSFYFVCFL
jgi:hypothetical protein